MGKHQWLNVVRCAVCLMMKAQPKKRRLSKWKKCFCAHPDAHGPHNLKSALRFIGFTRLGHEGFRWKSTPFWHPEKVPVKVLEISSADANMIIACREPRGLFFVREDRVYVGIDNSTGDAWVEEFDSLIACKRWLFGADDCEKP